MKFVFYCMDLNVKDFDETALSSLNPLITVLEPCLMEPRKQIQPSGF